eukprot:CAMPEP_0118950088 /NCGR_PEP_ID=MMETSP1169-20130426/50743_1 /TAXON_ID=36882 /ORGANISM="Pyramimonas obovata, Strain CCMP722" /LENGTH=131 /DNA_ID=CAMNT_0006896853 /DNA_START=219 /DNA_END=609 /DNA_ORIENTATION=+
MIRPPKAVVVRLRRPSSSSVENNDICRCCSTGRAQPGTTLSSTLAVDNARAALVVVKFGHVLILREHHLGKDGPPGPDASFESVLRHVLRGRHHRRPHARGRQLNQLPGESRLQPWDARRAAAQHERFEEG